MAPTFPGLAMLLASPRSSARRSPQAMQPSAELLQIEAGAWAAWAQRYPAGGTTLASDFERRDVRKHALAD